MDNSKDKKTFVQWFSEKNKEVKSKSEIKKILKKPLVLINETEGVVTTSINFDRVSTLNPANKAQIVTFLQTAIEEIKNGEGKSN